MRIINRHLTSMLELTETTSICHQTWTSLHLNHLHWRILVTSQSVFCLFCCYFVVFLKEKQNFSAKKILLLHLQQQQTTSGPNSVLNHIWATVQKLKGLRGINKDSLACYFRWNKWYWDDWGGGVEILDELIVVHDMTQINIPVRIGTSSSYF